MPIQYGLAGLLIQDINQTISVNKPAAWPSSIYYRLDIRITYQAVTLMYHSRNSPMLTVYSSSVYSGVLLAHKGEPSGSQCKHHADNNIELQGRIVLP